jgi:hypothetical protein
LLVGLTGPSGAHKTVIAKRFEKRFGFDRIHAGDPIKNGLREGFKLDKSQVRGKGKDRPAHQLGGATPRSVLEAQGTGTSVAAPGATATRLHKRLMKRMSRGKNVVVDGVRQEAEARVIRRLGGHIIRADNGEKPNESMPMDKKQASIIADSTIDTSGKKKSIHEAVDGHVMSHLHGLHGD